MLRGGILFLLLAVWAGGQVPVGASRKEVIDTLGWPKSTSTAGDRELLYYPDYSVVLENGRVEKLQFNPKSGKLPNTYTPPVRIPERSARESRPVTPKAVLVPTPEERLGPVPQQGPGEVSIPVKPRPSPLPPASAPEKARAVKPSVPPDTIGSVVFRSLAPWALLFGVILGLKLIIGKKLARKTREMRDEMPGSMNSAERLALGLPPKIVPPDRRPSYREPVPGAWSSALLKAIEWHRFEHLVAAYERELGNDAELTDFGPDGGIDIRVFEKEGRTPKRIIQCKAFDNVLVDVKLVRELLGVMTHEKATQGAFYTTSGFTTAAFEFGQEHLELDLVDGRTFLNRISRLQPDAQARLMAVATEGDYTTPTCSSCGVKMILKTAGKGRDEGSSFWGCRNYPRCRQTLRIAKSA